MAESVIHVRIEMGMTAHTECVNCMCTPGCRSGSPIKLAIYRRSNGVVVLVSRSADIP